MGLRRRRHRVPEAWVLLAVGLCLLVVVAVDVVFVGGQRAQSATTATARYPLPAVSGEFRLSDPVYGLLPVGGPCKGLGPYDGMLGGTPVIVKDQVGTPVARGALDIGKVADGTTCQFELVVQDLPKADVYQFEVMGRAAGRYTYDQLTAEGWHVTLSFG